MNFRVFYRCRFVLLIIGFMPSVLLADEPPLMSADSIAAAESRLYAIEVQVNAQLRSAVENNKRIEIGSVEISAVRLAGLYRFRSSTEILLRLLKAPNNQNQGTSTSGLLAEAMDPNVVILNAIADIGDWKQVASELSNVQDGEVKEVVVLRMRRELGDAVTRTFLQNASKDE